MKAMYTSVLCRYISIVLSLVAHISLCKTELPHIVFIHLGSEIPAYLFDAVKQARLFNQEAHIVVIAERAAIKKVAKKVKSHGIDFVTCEQLHETTEHMFFKKASSLPQGFRDGFWFKTTERFFYLDELMSQYELNEVFHLEYDNMLYVELNELLPVFRTYQNIAAIFDSDNRCIPGFIYFAKPESARRLVQYIAQMASKGINDMEVLASFKHQYTTCEIDQLPIVMPEYIRQYGLRSAMGHTTQSFECYAHCIQEFDSIFDGAAWGQFLGGIDPLNGTSRPGFINETCLFDPSKIMFEWSIDEQGRKVPYACMENKKYRINNLHIHSKNLKAFASC